MKKALMLYNFPENHSFTPTTLQVNAKGNLVWKCLCREVQGSGCSLKRGELFCTVPTAVVCGVAVVLQSKF